MRNQAFAFIKPHAMKSQAIATYIADVFEDADVKVPFSRRRTGPEIAKGNLIDRHFGAVSRIAFADDVARIGVTDAGREAFRVAFGKAWDDVVAEGKVVNCPDVCALLDNLSPEELCSMWAGHGAVEIGPDVFVSWFDEADRYVLNGFYPVLRKSYLAEGASVQLMLLDFDMDWHEFREAVIGSENPAAALEESVRGYLYDRAGALEMVIDPVDNILHVSASPFAALCEKMIWLDEAQWIEDPLLLALAGRTGREPRELADRMGVLAADPAVQARFVDKDTENVAESLAARIAKS
jgi:hypothetical protein